ncbi:MAG: hypothetical protein IPJ03_02755 [Ignavibacteriales bacterium]|nr:hypothetical protein [Ignavibacteriales bacterium]
MRSIHFLVVIAFLFTGCSSIGTKTLYRATKNNIVIKNIGVINLVTDSTNIKICPTIKSVSESAIKESFLENTDFQFIELEDSKDFQRSKLDKNSLSDISNKKHFDAILIVDSRFMNVDYTIAFIPVASEYHSESLITLFNNEGDKLISISQNTMRGDNYIERPSAEVTVNDAIQIALKKLLGNTRSLNEKISN